MILAFCPFQSSDTSAAVTTKIVSKKRGYGGVNNAEVLP